MARPVRKLWKMRTVVRRRHRTWMVSMTLASLGWGCWWVFAFLKHFAPSWAPSASVTSWISYPFALLGLLAAIWTIRAKLAWILITLVPLLANASVLMMPLLMKTLRVVRQAEMRTDSVTPVGQELQDH